MSTPKVNLSLEAMAAVIEMCDPTNLNSNISQLEWVEEELQKKAYEDGDSDYLFRYAYNLKLIRQHFTNLLTALGYERESD